LEVLRRITRQTHLHVILIGSGQALLDVYEFESTFGLEKLISISESACKDYFDMDFIAAKEEYDHTYELMELFQMSDVLRMRPAPGFMPLIKRNSKGAVTLLRRKFQIDDCPQKLARYKVHTPDCSRSNACMRRMIFQPSCGVTRTASYPVVVAM
jgi:hypothetical protein